jgi:hypothetical protein
MTKTRLLVSFLFAFLGSIPSLAAETHGVTFEASPGEEWKCGLSNDDLPGLAVERMRQPVAAGCASGDARAYVVIVDLSDSRSAMAAEQMAGDAEEQLPESWKIDSKVFEVVTLANGRNAAYSRLVGKGDGFTFVSGSTPMIAISANVPLLFEDDAKAAHQAIAVFRLRAPLPAASKRKDAIAAFDRTLRAWAATARPARGRPISDRDFELAAYARTRTAENAAALPPLAAKPASENRPDRFPAALAAAVTGDAPGDVHSLEELAKKYPNTAVGSMARSYLDRTTHAQRVKEELAILTAALSAAPASGTQLLSDFIIGAFDSGDGDAFAGAIAVARARGWTLEKITPAAATKVTKAITTQRVPPLAGDVRPFFEVASPQLLQMVQSVTPVPDINAIARPTRDTWRMKTRNAPPAVVVRHDGGIGVLSREGVTEVYRYRVLTNLLDVPVTQ